MPIYDYRCTACDNQVEITKNYDAPAPTCYKCGATMQKLISGRARFRMPGQVLEGGGADRFTADTLGIPLKDLPQGLKS